MILIENVRPLVKDISRRPPVPRSSHRWRSAMTEPRCARCRSQFAPEGRFSEFLALRRPVLGSSADFGIHIWECSKIRGPDLDPRIMGSLIQGRPKNSTPPNLWEQPYGLGLFFGLSRNMPFVKHSSRSGSRNCVCALFAWTSVFNTATTALCQWLSCFQEQFWGLD